MCYIHSKTNKNARVMKTTKLFLSIALVTLTITAFGNYNSSIETVYESELSLESWMITPFESAVLEEALSLESWMVAPFENAVSEEDLAMESWMVAPFESNISEEDLAMELWMEAPFASCMAEEGLVLEPWMSTPFNAGNEICVESWMIAAWN